MKTKVVLIIVLLGTAARAQETKPVPKDSVRVFVPGCSRGMMFTAGAPSEDRPGGTMVPEGIHLRMNGPKKMMSEIKAHEGSMIELTGIIKKGQVAQDGVAIGGGVRITGGPTSSGGLRPNPGPGTSPIMIDVEGWRRILGDCPSQ